MEGTNVETTEREWQPGEELRPDFALPAPDGSRQKRTGALIRRLRLVWSGRRFLALATAAGLLFGIFLAFLIPKEFQSTTQLMPPDSNSGSSMTMLESLAGRTNQGFASSAADLLGMKTSGDLFIGVLRSVTVQNRLIERFDLKKIYGQKLEVAARRELMEKTAITEDRKSGIITITVTDNDPKRSAALAQAYVEELDRLVAEVSTGAAHRERVFLQERLQSIKPDLDSASQALSEFSSKNNTIDIQEQGRAMVSAAAILQGQLIASESQLQGLRQIYAEDNARIRDVRARVEEMRHQLDEMTRGAAGKGGPMNADSPYPSLRELPLLGVTYAELVRKTKIEEAVYETLTQEFELAKVQEAKETPSVKVLDVAQVPEKKSFPPRAEIVLLCAFLALVGATIFVLGRAQWAAIDPNDEAKVFANEIIETLYARVRRRPRQSRTPS